MEELDPVFRPLLRHHDLNALETQFSAAYCVWADFRLAYVNPAWYRFAANNGGEPQISDHWGLGVSIFKNMPDVIVDYFRLHYNECMRTEGVWNHTYECSSDSVYRLFYQTTYSLDHGNGQLVSNSLVIEKPHDSKLRPARAADDSVYRDEQGILHQCAHCRRIQNVTEIQRWDWVPEWVRHIPENTSHTFCPPCFGYYYPIGGVGT